LGLGFGKDHPAFRFSMHGTLLYQQIGRSRFPEYGHVATNESILRHPTHEIIPEQDVGDMKKTVSLMGVSLDAIAQLSQFFDMRPNSRPADGQILGHS
jgi:uncharacterized SAM-dependent methyltransferase